MKRMNFDAQKLRDYLTEHEILGTTLSKAMGYNESFISNIITQNSGISEASYNLLCLTLGCDKSTFLKTEEAQLDRIERKLDELLKVWR